MTGGELIVKLLEQHDIDFVFGVLADQDTSIFNALSRSPKIRYRAAQTSQGAGLIADGYARATGKVGVCITPRGQTPISTVAGIATAYTDGIPLLLITVQVPSAGLSANANNGKPKEYSDYVDVLKLFKPITKWNICIKNPDEISKMIVRAFRVMATGRPSPIHLEIPIDIVEAELGAPSLFKAPPMRHIPGAQRLNVLAAEILGKAKYPLIIAGGGVVSARAGPELMQIAEILNAPILITPMSKGVFPSDHPLYAGLTWQPFVADPEHSISAGVDKADAVLSVGCSLSQRTTGDWKLSLPKHLIQIDIDEKEIGKNYPVQVGIVADAKIALEQLVRTISAQEENGRSQWGNFERQLYLPQYIREGDLKIVQILQDVLEKQTILAAEGPYLVDLLLSDLDVALPRSFLHACDLPTVGYALPAALGAKFAYPDQPAVAITDTAGFLTSGVELTTAVKYGLNVLTIINNQGLNEKPDFVKFAESLGVRGFRVDKIDQLETAVRDAQTKNQPTVIEARLSS
jgi:acetolactate synthase-1/2/3 large subunit